MSNLLPEEEEYASVDVDDPRYRAKVTEQEARDLLALAFGSVVLLAAMFIVLMVASALTGWGSLLMANLAVAVLAIISVVYLQYRRSRLMLGP